MPTANSVVSQAKMDMVLEADLGFILSCGEILTLCKAITGGGGGDNGFSYFCTVTEEEPFTCHSATCIQAQ